MVHWLVVLGTGLAGLAIGIALGCWITYKLAEVAASAEDSVSDIRPRFP